MTGRDWIDSLPAELDGQKAIMRRLLGQCERDSRIRWLGIGCSLGRGAADRLSDLDMALGVRDEDFDAAIGDIRVIVDGLAELVDSYHHLLPEVAGPHERVFAQYADRCQLDLVVFPASRQLGSGPGIAVLYDADDHFVAAAPRPGPTPEWVRETAFRAWCTLADAGKYLRRQSPWEALERLHEGRNQWWQLWAAAHDVPDSRYGITSLLDFAPGLVAADAAATVADLDLDRLLAAARALAGKLNAIGEYLPEELRAVLPDAMAHYIIADLDALAVGAGGGASWAPAECTLPTAEQPLRVAEFGDLFAGAVRSVSRPEPGILRLELRPDREVAAQAAGLAAAETDCCSFFTFMLAIGDDSLTLEVGVPPARIEILDALAELAAAAT